MIAPMVKGVVGVDASLKRVQICTENADKLGIKNVKFIRVPPGEKTPFIDNSFDCVTAASSIEQTPNPKETLEEMFRILKPGGKLRMANQKRKRCSLQIEFEYWAKGNPGYTEG